MSRNSTLQVMRLMAAAALSVAMSSVASAHGGGGGGFSGGDSGDSSMNPFTGDSYAYFHGGHNLGEQGTIRPNRPNPRFSTGQNPQANAAPNADAKAPATASAAKPQDSQSPGSDVSQQSRRAAPSD